MLQILVLGKTYFFEWHRWFGPSQLDGRTGDPVVRQPGENSPFWPAVQWWHDQGLRVDSDNYAVWEPRAEDMPITVPLGPRSGLVVGYEKRIPKPFGPHNPRKE